MRRKAASSQASKARSKQRRQLTLEIRRWFAAEIAVWPDDHRLPLNWHNVVAKGGAIHGWSWSRSGLSRCPEIAAAFAKRSSELAAGRGRMPKNPARADEVRTRERLLAQIAQLKLENEKLTRQFRTWQKNAHAMNITVEQLEEPWDEVDRGQTDLELRAKKGLSLPQHGSPRPKKR